MTETENAYNLLSNLEIHLNLSNYIEVVTVNTISTIERVSPTARDRGDFIWKAWSKDNRVLTIDDCDFFPRYFFNFECLCREIFSWCLARSQSVITIEIKTPE